MAGTVHTATTNPLEMPEGLCLGFDSHVVPEAQALLMQKEIGYSRQGTGSIALPAKWRKDANTVCTTASQVSAVLAADACQWAGRFSRYVGSPVACSTHAVPGPYTTTTTALCTHT